MAPTVCLLSLIKLHVAMGDHPAFLCQQPVYRLVGLAQYLHAFPQVHRLHPAGVGQHRQLVQVPAPAPQ